MAKELRQGGKRGLPRSVRDDISKRSKVFGVVLGLLCIPTAFLGGALGACCPVGAFVGVIPVVIWAAIGGFLSSMFLDWSAIGNDVAISVGARTGLRTGLIASTIGALATLVVTVMVSGSLGAVAANSDSQFQSADAAMATGGTLAMNAVAAVVALVPGSLLGVLGGVIGAAIKKK